jgi:RNA polymerase sigma-70 factor (ECF subfamily)
MSGPPGGAIPEEELIRLAKADPDGAEGRNACGELLRRYSDAVYLYCFRMVRDRDTALDLAQEALLDALKGIRGFEARSRFSSWLFAIARNRCRTALRPRSLMRDEDADLESLVEPGGDPASRWLEQDGERRLERLVSEHLEPEEQEAIWLRYVEGMPVDEITRVLNLENATGARGLLQTALRKLRAARGRAGEEPGGPDER